MLSASLYWSAVGGNGAAGTRAAAGAVARDIVANGVTANAVRLKYPSLACLKSRDKEYRKNTYRNNPRIYYTIMTTVIPFEEPLPAPLETIPEVVLEGLTKINAEKPVVEVPVVYVTHLAQLINYENFVRYFYKLGCGCVETNSENVEKHSWVKCENASSEFWIDRFKSEGRTTAHSIRKDEVSGIFCRCDIHRDDLHRIEEMKKTAAEKLGTVGMEYVEMMNRHLTQIAAGALTLHEEKRNDDELKDWFLRHNLTPPRLVEIHIGYVEYDCADLLLKAFENEEVKDVCMFGNYDEEKESRDS